MDFSIVMPIVAAVLIVLAIIVALKIMVTLRRVVPTNMVHIVQSSKHTTPYGSKKDAGNTYYAWPAWVPVIGVSVIAYPESIFKIVLSAYEAYDSKRLPFIVDVAAFFRLDDASTVAQRVATFAELNDQLQNVLQGAVRRILAQNTLAQIMEGRAELAEQFTNEVKEQIKEWGVSSVKSIEFMDVRDTKGSEVIADIMAKEKSAIERDSRMAVAENNQKAQMAEIEAQRTVDIGKQEAMQQVGQREAEKEKAVGVAREKSQQDIQVEAKVTAEHTLAVQAVEAERAATIKKNVQITTAEAEQRQAEINAEAELTVVTKQAEGRLITDTKQAEGQLAITLKEAEGRKAVGEADANAEELMQMAPVVAQLALAKEIGTNKEYQAYLLQVEQIKAGSSVGITMATALGNADLKIISTGGGSEGGNILGGAAGLMDQFNVKGGVNIGGIIAGLAASPEGKLLVDRLTGANKAD